MNSESDHVWIADPAALETAIGSEPPAWVGLDTEFMRERTYWPQLALVQIAIGSDIGNTDTDRPILLIDPLAPGMTDAIARMLRDRRTLKIMHSAGEDLIAFQHTCGALPEPLFDTQIAAALCGVGAGMGYQRLVLELVGAAVDKGETRSDWLRRPLSPAQLRYAADDVRHLGMLRKILAERLHALGRESWMEEDCARALANAAEDAPERWPHLSLRAAQFLDRGEQVALARLLRWRDEYARRHDRPRSWILDNESAVALVRTSLPEIDALRRFLDQQPKAPRKLEAEIWAALNTASPDEADMPPVRGDDRDRQAFKKLQQVVAARSAELGLPDGVLASRRWLEALQDGQDWPGALSGWRRQQLEPALAPLLAVSASA